MKRIILIVAFMTLLPCMVLNAEPIDANNERTDSIVSELDEAQNEIDRTNLNKKIWGKGRFTRLGYAIAQTVDESGPVEKGQYGLFLTKGTTYWFPKKPIAGLFKIGLDAVWFDFQFSKFKSPYDSMKWTYDIDDIEIGRNDEEYDEDEDFDFNLNLGRMALSFGMGIGPNISVAPFALSSLKALQPLRASIYFHYAPTFQLYAICEGSEFEASTAFCHMMDFGGLLTYRAIGVGIEGKWGQGKFKPLDFGELMGDGAEGSTRKYKRKFANTRIYVQFTF